MRPIDRLLAGALLILTLPSFAKAQDAAKAEEPFRWNLSAGQILDVSLSARHQSKTTFLILSVAGPITLEAIDRDGTALGTWKIQTLSCHHRWVNEEKRSYSGGRWTQAVFTTHVARDAAHKAETEAEKNRVFQEEAKTWAEKGGTVPVKLGRSGLSVGYSFPTTRGWLLEGCWPSLKLPAIKGPPEKAELVPSRTGLLFSSHKIDKSTLTGRWTADGANPIYLEDGTVSSRYTVSSGHSIVENLKYSRTTSFSTSVGCVSKVSESFSVSSTADGKPHESSTGAFTLTLSRKN